MEAIRFTVLQGSKKNKNKKFNGPAPCPVKWFCAYSRLKVRPLSFLQKSFYPVRFL
jgi:hypothetical protein